MVLFAFSLLFLFFCGVKLVGEWLAGAAIDFKIDSIARRRQAFIASFASMPGQAEIVEANTDYSDVKDDISMIMGYDVSVNTIKYNAQGRSYFVNARSFITWKTAITQIRLSRMGKLRNSYGDLQGIYVNDTEQKREIALRYLNLLADNLRKHGIDTDIIIKTGSLGEEIANFRQLLE